MRRGRRQDLVGLAHGLGEALGPLHHLVDHGAAEQGEGARAHGRAGVMLAGGDHGDGHALVLAEARRNRWPRSRARAARSSRWRAPSRTAAPPPSWRRGADGAGVGGPSLLPAGDVAGPEAVEPKPKAEPHQPLRSLEARTTGASAPSPPARASAPHAAAACRGALRLGDAAIRRSACSARGPTEASGQLLQVLGCQDPDIGRVRRCLTARTEQDFVAPNHSVKTLISH